MTMISIDATQLDAIDHVAIHVVNIEEALAWYQTTFHCELIYQDSTWALIRFANVRLALVTSGQHPPHLAVERSDAEAFGPLRTHRDGTRSTYVHDPSRNAIEVLEARQNH